MYQSLIELISDVEAGDVVKDIEAYQSLIELISDHESESRRTGSNLYQSLIELISDCCIPADSIRCKMVSISYRVNF